MSAPVPSPEHQNMVDSLAKYFRDSLGLDLRGVAHDAYPQKTWEIGGKVPDVIAMDTGIELLVLGEAKTAGDISTDHTKEQLEAWSKQVLAQGKSKGVPVRIIVSVARSSENELDAALRKWGLRDRVETALYG